MISHMVDDTLITYIKICLKQARESKDDDLVYLNQPAVVEILKRIGRPALQSDAAGEPNGR